MRTVKKKSQGHKASKAAEPFFQPAGRDGLFANAETAFFKAPRVQATRPVVQRKRAPDEHAPAGDLTRAEQPQGPAVAHIQLARLLDYKNKKPEHDPSKLTDAEIEATNEFKAYMDPKLVWQTSLKVTKEEARLACRLMLRYMRDGHTVNWERKARSFVNKARKQLGTLEEAEKLTGKPEWVPLAVSDFTSPATSKSEFLNWILGSGPEPTNAGKMNCWEMVLFGAYKGKFTTKSWIEKVYKEVAKKTTAATISTELEKHLCGGAEKVYDTTDSKSPEPLPGDILIFNTAANHVAISSGKNGGKHEAISHWNPPGFTKTAQKTTIKKLLSHTGGTKVRFCTAPW